MTYPIEFQLFGMVLGLAGGVALLGRVWGRRLALRAVRSAAVPWWLARPRRLGPYVLGEKLGAGGMGEVYRAWHVGSRQPCAVKVLPRDAAARDRARLVKEAQITARLRHPNTVSVYEHGRARDGTAYYAMELLEGITLQALVERYGAQAPGRVIRILLQLCAALTEAHGAGIVHRDIKPENVVLCRNGAGQDTLKLLDFGLAQEACRGAELTRSTSAVVGTPLYISPEAIHAPHTVGPRSDLYALGALAYFLLAGAPVFGGESIVEVCSQHLHSEPAPLGIAVGCAISEDLERVVLECLAKDPARRPASAAELAQRLTACADSRTRSHEHTAEVDERAERRVTRSYTRLVERPLRKHAISVGEHRASRLALGAGG